MEASTSKTIIPLSYTWDPAVPTAGLGGPRKYGLCPNIEVKKALHDLEKRQQKHRSGLPRLVSQGTAMLLSF